MEWKSTPDKNNNNIHSFSISFFFSSRGQRGNFRESICQDFLHFSCLWVWQWYLQSVSYGMLLLVYYFIRTEKFQGFPLFPFYCNKPLSIKLFCYYILFVYSNNLPLMIRLLLTWNKTKSCMQFQISTCDALFCENVSNALYSIRKKFKWEKPSYTIYIEGFNTGILMIKSYWG